MFDKRKRKQEAEGYNAMRLKCLPVLQVSLWTFTVLAARVGAQPPTNEQLIAAMPRGTESVMVWRDSVLGAQHSCMREIIGIRDRRLLSVPYGAPDAATSNLRYDVFKYVTGAKPVAHARGGSRFEHPIALGLGNYVESWIWVLEESIAPLKTTLETRKDINKVVNPISSNSLIYDAEIQAFLTEGDPVTKHIYIAFPNEHIIVMAENRIDVACMYASLSDGCGRIPTYWADVASGLELESPITLIRTYNYFNATDPTLPRSGGLPMAFRSLESKAPWIQSIALTLPSVHERVFELQVIGSGMDDVLGFYRRIIEARLHQNCCTWEFTTEGSRIKITIRVPELGEPFLPFLSTLLSLFGQSLAV